jgi:preprotein translocase subunit YajC
VIPLLIIVAMLGVLWAVMIRPQKRRQATQAQMLSDLAIGDEILTAGGIYGKIDAIEEDELSLEVAPGTTIRIARRAVAAIIPDEEEEEEADDDAEHDEAGDDEPEDAGGHPAASVESQTSAEEKRG